MSALCLRPVDQMHHPSGLPSDPVAKLSYINKPLLFLTVRDVGLALVEEENRLGKKEVMSRSKCQKKRFLGLVFRFGCVCGAWGHGMGVCVCARHVCNNLFKRSLWDLLNKQIWKKALAKVSLDLLKNCWNIAWLLSANPPSVRNMRNNIQC